MARDVIGGSAKSRVRCGRSAINGFRFYGAITKPKVRMEVSVWSNAVRNDGRGEQYSLFRLKLHDLRSTHLEITNTGTVSNPSGL